MINFCTRWRNKNKQISNRNIKISWSEISPDLKDFESCFNCFKRSFVFSNYKSCCFWWHSPCHRAAHHAQMMKQTEDMILLFLLANISLRLDAAIISSLSANFFQINFNHCNTTNFCHLRLARQQALVNLWREMGL